MLDKDWRPDDMAATEEAASKMISPEDGEVSPHDAERFMIIAQVLSGAWVNHYSNATYFKEAARFKRDSSYQLAFLRSEAKSDKQREIDAKNDPSVRMAELALIEATAALKLAELRHDELVRSYHAFKKIVEISHEEKQYL